MNNQKPLDCVGTSGPIGKTDFVPAPPVGPIEAAADMPGRVYIPLAAGYEFQSKGSGSTARLVTPDHGRYPLPNEIPYLHERLEGCFTAQNKALTEAAVVIQDLLRHLEANFHDTGSCWVENAKQWMENHK